MQLSSIEIDLLTTIAARARNQAAADTCLITPGDLVQLHPTTDAAFGGMLAVVTQAAKHEVRGYLLRPHRGGCRAAWLRWPPRCVDRIGRPAWPANTSNFALRCEEHGDGATCEASR